MEAHTFQRIVAYLIDIIVITIFAVILTAWIPKSEKYKQAQKEEETLLQDFTDGKIDKNDYIDKSYELSYIIDKENVIETMISIVLTVGYFATYAYYNKGQTLGKKLTHIKVVSNDNNEATHLQFLGRTLIINGALVSIINLIIIFIIKSNQYSYTIGVLNIINSIVIIASLIMVACRKDKRGIHDLLFRTKVVETT